MSAAGHERRFRDVCGTSALEQFPDWPHGRQSGLEIPVKAANPARKQRQRGKPFVKRTANPAGQPGRAFITLRKSSRLADESAARSAPRGDRHLDEPSRAAPGARRLHRRDEEPHRGEL
jgi:hypothetical protein